MQKRICLIAPSGYGKSTAIKLISKNFKIKNIKIAEPLYNLQFHFYQTIDKTMNGEQDGELLQFFGAKIRKENPTFLLNEFKKQIDKFNNCDVIITNDDCRPPDYDYLKKLGFVFVEIKGFSHARQDHAKIDKKNSLEWQSEIKCDFCVENTSTLKQYEQNLIQLISKIIKTK